MRQTIRGGVLVWLVLACAAMANGEEQRPALTMGYPAAVGVLIPVGDRLAVRPELSFGRAWSDLPVSGVSSDSWSVGTGISALYYLSDADGLRTYVSPRLTYTHGSSSSTRDVASFFSFDRSTSSFESSTSSWGVTGSFGAQYAFGRRFGVFGEVGIGYHRTSSSSSSSFVGSNTDYHSNGVGTSTGVGVLFRW